MLKSPDVRRSYALLTEPANGDTGVGVATLQRYPWLGASDVHRAPEMGVSEKVGVAPKKAGRFTPLRPFTP